MSNFNEKVTFFSTTASRNKTFDSALQKFMSQVYNMMMMAIGISALTAFITIETGLIYAIFSSSLLFYLVLFAPLIYQIYSFGFSGQKVINMNSSDAKRHLVIYASLTGVWLSLLVFHFTGVSVVRTLLITASMFGAMSLYGYTTKRDLLSLQSFLIMGSYGLMFSFILNWFLHSTALHYATSFIGVILFSVFIAFHTQLLKNIFYMVPSSDKDKAAALGALNLFSSFVGLFVMLLQFFGDRR